MHCYGTEQNRTTIKFRSPEVNLADRGRKLPSSSLYAGQVGGGSQREKLNNGVERVAVFPLLFALILTAIRVSSLLLIIDIVSVCVLRIR